MDAAGIWEMSAIAEAYNDLLYVETTAPDQAATIRYDLFLPFVTRHGTNKILKPPTLTKNSRYS